MTKRPVAFRVRTPSGGYWLTELEGVAQRWVVEYDTTYEGLYLVADRNIRAAADLEREIALHKETALERDKLARLLDQPPRPTDIPCVKPPDPLY